VTVRLRRSEIAAAALMLLLSWLVIYPIVIVGAEAAHPTALRDFLTRPGEWAALWASVWISLVSVILAAAIGIPLAFLFEWFDFPGRKTLGALIALPVVLPPLVGVIAFLFGDLIILPIVNIHRKYYRWRTALVLLGMWGGLIAFVGPYFDYAYTPNSEWTYNTGDMQKWLITPL